MEKSLPLTGMTASSLSYDKESMQTRSSSSARRSIFCYSNRSRSGVLKMGFDEQLPDPELEVLTQRHSDTGEVDSVQSSRKQCDDTGCKNKTPISIKIYTP